MKKILNLVRNLRRKRKHKRYVDVYLSDLHWTVINAAVALSYEEEDLSQKIKCCGKLIRKYERRRKLLRF